MLSFEEFIGRIKEEKEFLEYNKDFYCIPKIVGDKVEIVMCINTTTDTKTFYEDYKKGKYKFFA